MKKHIAEHIPDALLFIGAGLLSYGAALIYLPAGFIAAGLSAAGLGVLAARRD